MVSRRAPWSLRARPPSHCASVISNRSICGTAPAMFSNASIRPNAASVWSTTLFAADISARSISMMSGSAPAALTASAVFSRLGRSRAASTTDEKSRARRIAVERLMPWLAPVTIATDVDISCLPILEGAAEEFADGCGDLRGVRFQGEMTGVEEANDRAGNVALEGFRARRQKERIVLAPHGEQRRPMGTEIVLEVRIERDVALVVAKQVELDLVGAGTRQIEIVQRPAIGRDGRLVSDTVGVLPARRFRREEGAERLPIGRRRVLPVSSN